MTGCRDTLEALGDARIDVPELSGLAPHPGPSRLVAVGDDSGSVYVVELAPSPRVTRRIRLERGKRYDLEGVAVAPDAQTLLVVAEKKRRVLRYDWQGRRIENVDLDLRVRKKNAGLEGLTVDADTGRVFVVNELKPRHLYELDETFDTVAKTKLRELEDLSGICAHAGALWIVSDESAALVRLEEKAGEWSTTGRWPLPGPGAEGVAIVGDRVYVAFDHGRDGNDPNLRWFRRPA
jgi:uncharacterized protein YjiK